MWLNCFLNLLQVSDKNEVSSIGSMQLGNRGLSRIRAQACFVGATVYIADEVGIQADYHTGMKWPPIGETPVLTVTGRRFALNMISAVSPRGTWEE
jgi:hypothetical protein